MISLSGCALNSDTAGHFARFTSDSDFNSERKSEGIMINDSDDGDDDDDDYHNYHKYDDNYNMIMMIILAKFCIMLTSC